MIQQITLQDCVGDFRPDIETYWGRKANRVRKVLGHVPPDLQRLQLVVAHRRFQHQARAVLKLPTGTLVAEGSSPNYREALDLAADRLVEEVRKHQAHVRRDYAYHCRRPRPPVEAPPASRPNTPA